MFIVQATEAGDQSGKNFTIEQHSLKNVNSYLNTNVYSYLETSGVQTFIYIIM